MVDIKNEFNSTRIVGTDTRMSKVILESGKTETAKNSRLCVAFGMFFQILVHPLVRKLETNMSKSIVRLDICMSKVILESGKTKTAKNSRLCVAFRIFFWIFSKPNG